MVNFFSFGVYNGSVARSCVWQLRRKSVLGVMAKVDYTCKPSAYESEIHPSHKSKICTLCISRLHRAKRGCSQTDLARAA